MTEDQFLANFEIIAEESTLTVSSRVLKKLSKRAYEIQGESDFSIDDVTDELVDVIPVAFFEGDEGDEWNELISEIADTVFAELSEDCDDEDDDSDCDL